ncbi:insulysin [Nematocida sp. LUAm3]|nr:insulysin [Nematocida sp. LUAm3]KAI5174687.1 insulysin [Nematocida sp. LUAm2]KAI5177902.1 insulysin [Nematocida sp. LUAm1]
MLVKLSGGEDIYEYRIITLENGIKAMVSSSKDADKAAVSLSIKAGGFMDPLEYPGLAHFLEHMLFMGTEKHPSENEYMEYVHNHNGTSNAYTASEVTNYYFDIDANYLEGAIDIFSGFFKYPLIVESALERELEAVNHEHCNNILSEPWRKNHLRTLLSKRDTPLSKFQTGSLDTLGRATRKNIVEFWEKEYTPSRMCLVIHGKESLDELEALSRKYFSDIKLAAPQEQPTVLPTEPPAKAPVEASTEETALSTEVPADGATDNAVDGDALPKASADEDALPKASVDEAVEESASVEEIVDTRSDTAYQTFRGEVLGKVVKYRPAIKIHTKQALMSIIIALPEVISKYRRKTLEYIIGMIEGTGETSFTTILLINGVSTGISIEVDYSTFNTFLTVEIELTQEKKGQVKALSNLLLKHLEIIKEHISDELYNLFASIEKLEFEYKESQDPISHVEEACYTMQFYPAEEFTKHKIIWDGLDRKEFEEFMNIITNQSKWVTLYRTEDLEWSTEVIVDPIYGINYTIEDIEEPDSKLFLDLSEQLIWNVLPLQEVDIESIRTTEIQPSFGSIPTNVLPIAYPDTVQVYERKGEFYEAYLIHNPKYNIKETEVNINLFSSEHLTTPKKYAAFMGYILALSSFFKEKYAIELSASLSSFSLTAEEFFIRFSFKGIPKLISDLIEKFLSEYVQQQSNLFNLAKETSISYFQKKIGLSPYKHIRRTIQKSRGFPAHSPNSCIAEAQNLSPEDIFSLTKGEVKILITGNTSEKEFDQLTKKITTYLEPSCFSFSVSPPAPEAFLHSEDPLNRAVAFAHPITKFTQLLCAAYSILLNQIRSETFFDEVRTKDKFGYIVNMNNTIILKESYLLFLVQSTRPYEEIKERINLFLLETPKCISKLTEEEYSTHQKSACSSVDEEPLNLSQYTEEIFYFWMNNHFNAIYKKDLSSAILSITKQDLLDYCKNLLSNTTLIHVSNK